MLSVTLTHHPVSTLTPAPAVPALDRSPKMKIAATMTILLTLLFAQMALADGYSFNENTQEMTCDSIQLVLSDTQVDEVSATGTLTFTEEQRALLKRFYANIPPKIGVISSRRNDGAGERDPNIVDCIWLSPAHVGITLIKKYGDTDYAYETESLYSPDLRFSPEGDIYSRGAKISKEGALEMIRAAKRVNGGGEPFVNVTLPPPYREKELAKKNVIVMNLYKELVKFGEQSGVNVKHCP